LVGKGRMAEPEEIIQAIQIHFTSKHKIAGKRILVTAGPTYEAIDPVRFIGNHSSGKMGYRIASEFASRGAEVTLISGPSQQAIGDEVCLVKVVSAQEMFDAVNAAYTDVDLVVMSAAVADYKPKNVSSVKLKKEKVDLSRIEMEPTVDILHYLGSNKKSQKLVGFALETDNELSNAKSKLKRKNLDMLVLNSLNDQGAGFGTDTNKVTFVFHDSIKEFGLKSKEQVAIDIADHVEGFF
jgi:phosphopantothenoylcysteine decarboxylase/phosphopantothenate--cysteine ligase